MIQSASPANPAMLIKARITEKRLYEARFLLNRLAEELEPATRQALRDEVIGAITRAERIMVRVTELEDKGLVSEALDRLTELENVAVDHPDLDETRQRLRLALELGDVKVVDEPDTGPARVPAPDPDPVPASRLRKADRLMLLAGLPAALAAALLFFWLVKPAEKEKKRGPEPAPATRSLARPAQRPVLARQPSVPDEAVESDPASSASDQTAGPREHSDALITAITPIPELDKAPGAARPSRSAQVGQKTETSSSSFQPATGQETEEVAAGQERKQAVTAETEIPEERTRPETSPDAPVAAAQDSAPVVAEMQHDKSEPEQEQEPLPTQSDDASDQGEVSEDAPVPDDSPGGHEEEKPATVSSAPGSANDQKGESLKPQTTDPVRTYVVQAGDTLESIAEKVYGDRYTWSRLVEANQDRLGRSGVLSVGMELRVPPPDQQPRTWLNSDGTYTVRSGDSLGSIARKVYGTSRRWQELYRLNRDRLRSPADLQVGMVLRVSDHQNEQSDPDPVGE